MSLWLSDELCNRCTTGTASWVEYLHQVCAQDGNTANVLDFWHVEKCVRAACDLSIQVFHLFCSQSKLSQRRVRQENTVTPLYNLVSVVAKEHSILHRYTCPSPSTPLCTHQPWANSEFSLALLPLSTGSYGSGDDLIGSLTWLSWFNPLSISWVCSFCCRSWSWLAFRPKEKKNTVMWVYADLQGITGQTLPLSHCACLLRSCVLIDSLINSPIKMPKLCNNGRIVLSCRSDGDMLRGHASTPVDVIYKPEK